MYNIQNSDVEWRELWVEGMDRAEFEAFLDRNQIPFCKNSENCQQVYLIRDGVDFIDSSIYALKYWGDLKDADTTNIINRLVLQHNFAEIRYNYELDGWYRTEEDSSVLGKYIGLEADSDR